MKKSLILLPLAAVLLSLTGCKKDNEKSGPSGETVTLSATLGGGEKTEIDGVKMKWSEGDAVAINDKPYTAKLSNEDKTATFEVDRADDGKYCAYYPASLYDEGNNKYVLPSTQYYNVENGNILSDISPMYAETDTKELHFYHICALMKLQVTGEGTVKKIVVTSTDNLCGTFTVSEDGGKYHAVISGSGSTTLTLNCGTGVALNATTPTTFYIALPQGTLRNLEFTFVNGSNEWTSQSIATANLTAGKLYTKSLEKGEYQTIPGALDGEFTINASGNKVNFSQGNLQYHTANKIWRFAENQYDMLDNTTSTHTTSDYADGSNKWIDLFGWGTTGSQDTRTSSTGCQKNYQPYSTSNKAVGSTDPAFSVNRYGYGPDYDATNMYGLSVAYLSDWGYNAISNGGNRENAGWRTLTKDEWEYLFDTRNPSSGVRYAKATVNEVAGVILVPDNWSTSTYSLQSTNTTNAAFTVNDINEQTWKNTLEPAGCVFLPAAGSRTGTSVSNVGSYGYYWSSTPNAPNGVALAHNLIFYSSKVDPAGSGRRDYGRSVRLVLPVEN